MTVLKNTLHLSRVLFKTVTSQNFIAFSIIGNTFIFLVSHAFYYVEHGLNVNIQNHLDSIWWAYTTATTVGYGDITPVTTIGKLLGIFLMLSGTTLFAIFTAIFAQSIWEDELLNFRKKGALRNSLNRPSSND